MITAKSILASQHADAPHRVDTLLLRYPRWIHAEGRTHRVLRIGEDMEVEIRTPSLMEDPNLSRNASSSRAIPVSRLIQDVLDDPAIPLFWGKNQKGMQATEEFSLAEQATLVREWLADRDAAIARARYYADFGCHKQIVNRLLEPFSHITVVVTATEWSNFFALRDHADAEPHIAMLARAMKTAMAEAHVQTLKPGQWHLPFVSVGATRREINMRDGTMEADWVKLSVSRCASTSYRTVDGFDMTLDRAVDLHEKLVAMVPLHASPCEHQCYADQWYDHLNDGAGGWAEDWGHGNLKGFVQYRKTLPGERQ
jgi:hypothetical protein